MTYYDFRFLKFCSASLFSGYTPSCPIWLYIVNDSSFLHPVYDYKLREAWIKLSHKIVKVVKEETAVFQWYLQHCVVLHLDIVITKYLLEKNMPLGKFSQ